MKYFKKKSKSNFNIILFVVVVLFTTILFFNKNSIQRSLITVNLGSLYVEYLNEKAELLSFLNSQRTKEVSILLSSNNFVKLQKERAKMVTNFVKTGSLWQGKNNYFKVNFTEDSITTKGEIKLFGMNPDHYRNSRGHSFRIKFDGGYGYGNRRYNFMNPRSRDFITDPLLNIIYNNLSGGLKINYDLKKIKINKSKYGLFLQEDFFDKYLIELNRKRESVIFENYSDSLVFNHIGDNDEFKQTSLYLQNLFSRDYDKFIEMIDHEKLKLVLLLSLIINDNHPLGDGNMHWYYNPVNGLIEPTIREGFAYNIESIDINNLLNSSKLIRDIYNKKLESDFTISLYDDLQEIKNIINNDSDYMDFKEKMIGFSDQINKRERIIKNNIEVLQSYFKKHNNLYETKIINVKNDTIISGDIIVQANEKLLINKGVNITLSNAFIKVYGEIEAIGTKVNPITINGNNGSGTIFINSSDKIRLDYVNFQNLTNNKSPYNQPASITFYECNNIIISNSSFRNNSNGDDFLNFFRSKNIKLQNLEFENILNDAIDSDFSELEIVDSKFNNIGNDAIDGSGSTIVIKNNIFSNVQDKAISAGENSSFKILASYFNSNELALVSKDGSKIKSTSNIFTNNNLDFASFVKKKFYGPSETTFNNDKIKSFLIEEKSIVKGLDSISYSYNVESKLYGNLYGKASQ
tara:strand:- start:279 stop:2351 length:2073 start_codon:yes stop_codon:yes gene_type:complete